MKVIGHRGFSGEYPENTMLSFKKAAETGCHGIELDVQLTRDGVPVIIHDETVERTSNGKGHVCHMTYEALARLDFSCPSVFQGRFEALKIPTLEEYLKWAASETKDFITNIELKNGFYYYYGMEEKVVRLVIQYGLENRVILSSLNHLSIMKCKKMAPQIQAGFLVNKYMENAGVFTREHNIEYYHPNIQFLTEEHVKNCYNNGIGINVWTVNEKEDMRAMRKAGVYSIITNYPDRGMEVMKEELE